MPVRISRIIVFIKDPLFSISAWHFSLWHVFLLFWLLGCICGIFLLLRSYRRFGQSIRVLGDDITGQEPCYSILQQICAKQKQPNIFRVVEMPYISSPLITGLFHPIILIPQNLSADPTEWHYILSHEIAHYFHHDLWYKLLTQLLCILYWWNPLLYIFRRQISTMLELRIDRNITAFTNQTEKLRYMECLNHLANQEKALLNPLSISFCITGRALLLQRFRMIGDSEGHRRSRRKQIIMSGIIICLYLFSTIFIFEPHYTPPQIAEKSYELTIDNAYFIVNLEGGYDLYMESQFIGTFYEPLDETLNNLKIYNTEEEISNE